MFRIAIILGAVVVCWFYAAAPDPRVLDALQMSANTAGSRVADSPEEEFYCPMEPDVRAPEPGFCSRCGMRLIKGLKDAKPYLLNIGVQTPSVADPELKRITLEVRNPATGKPERDFEVVHEKLYHLFVVSQDLSFFLHTHPERRRGEDFHADIRFPKPGTYRVLSDFYPRDGGPQLIKNTLMISEAGPAPVIKAARCGACAPQSMPIKADLHSKESENAHVELELAPVRIVAGQKATLTFRIIPDDGLEPYLGAMAHMLAASSDLIDMIHNHPSQALDEPGGAAKDLVFNSMLFPREGLYRVWIQFQRLGIVNTAAFDIVAGSPR